jgi:hypothetical protein
MFGIFKRRRQAREAAAEAERQRLRALADRTNRIVERETFQAGKSSLSSSPPQYASRADDSLALSSPLHPLNPLALVSVAEAYAPRDVDPSPVRCSPTAGDDSSRNSSSSDSCSGSSGWGGSDSSSYDSGGSSGYDSSPSY